MPTITCSYCGKEFERSVGNINENAKRGHKSYCSVECQRKAQNRRVLYECDNCGKKL